MTEVFRWIAIACIAVNLVLFAWNAAQARRWLRLTDEATDYLKLAANLCALSYALRYQPIWRLLPMLVRQEPEQDDVPDPKPPAFRRAD